MSYCGTIGAVSIDTPRVDVPMHVCEITEASGEHAIERGSVAKIHIRPADPVVGEGRLPENRMQTTVDSDHVRKALYLIARQVSNGCIKLPVIDGLLAGREERSALSSVKTPRVGDAEEAPERRQRSWIGLGWCRQRLRSPKARVPFVALFAARVTFGRATARGVGSGPLRTSSEPPPRNNDRAPERAPPVTAAEIGTRCPGGAIARPERGGIREFLRRAVAADPSDGQVREVATQEWVTLE